VRTAVSDAIGRYRIEDLRPGVYTVSFTLPGFTVVRRESLQVSGTGDIANWAVPGKDVLGVGGAMDLVVGAGRVLVTMTATSSAGEPKVVAECTYPLTARAAADVVITELSVFRLRDGALVLTELLGGASVDDVRSITAAPFTVDLDARPPA